MLQSGARWRDCPREYGPYTTVYNRFNRWAKRGRWSAIFEALAKPGKDAVALSLDSTSIKAHRCASGGKGGSTIKQSAARAEAAPRKSMR
jgi:transposase